MGIPLGRLPTIFRRHALYSLVVGVNTMSASFAHDLLKHIPLTPTTKLLKSLLGHILLSLGIPYVLPIQVKGNMVHLSFYIFDIMEFDLLIGQPIERLIEEGQTAKLKISLGKNFKLSIPITHSLNAESEPIPEEDPMEEVKVASLDDLIEPSLEDDAQFFIEEDKSSIEPKPLDELKEPPSPSLSLNPCLLVLDMLFSIMIRILL